MIQYSQIREVHLELSTNCNASCPLCPRNFHGYPLNNGYPITELSLDDIRVIFPNDFIQQLNFIMINGNLGDFMLAKDALEIVQHFREVNPQLRIEISTNGSARFTEFWETLARYRPVVKFALDGLEDTHSLYRKDTRFDTIIRNAQTFISAGGHAVWKMVQFDHNRHQLDQCRQLASQMGFHRFELVNHGRDHGPVFDRQGNFSYMLGSHPPVDASYISYIGWRKKSHDAKDHWKVPPSPVTCVTKTRSHIYVAANGEVYPCCWTGFYPRTFGTDVPHYGNDQLRQLMQGVENNAKLKPLEECIQWFNLIEESWKKDSFESGRLWMCHNNCGVKLT